MMVNQSPVTTHLILEAVKKAGVSNVTATAVTFHWVEVRYHDRPYCRIAISTDHITLHPGFVHIPLSSPDITQRIRWWIMNNVFTRPFK